MIFACQENNDFALNCNEINFIEEVTKNLQLLASVLLEFTAKNCLLAIPDKITVEIQEKFQIGSA